VPLWLFSHLRDWRIPARLGAPVQPSTPQYPLFPVYLLSHGLGGTPEAYAGHAIEMASHGYVVVMPHHHDRSAAWRFNEKGEFETFWRMPPGADEHAIRRQQVEQRAQEMLSAHFHLLSREEFSSRVEREFYYIGGHSFGGATAMKTALADPRARLAAIADIWMLPLGDDTQTPLSRSFPWLDIQSDQWVKWAPNWEASRRLAPLETLHLLNTRHGNFSDFCLVSNPVLRHLGIIGRENPFRVLQEYSRLVLRFFARGD
jgi:alpha-beta hydrolase superfamily lysophospholipase